MPNPFTQATPAKCANIVLALAALLPVTGCHVDANKNSSNEKVSISTPFGDMSVKTDENAVGQGVGLPVYPGATLINKENNGHDDGAADVNMSFGSFHLGVKAVTYRSQDDPGKVLTFYRKNMTKYGTVIECNGQRLVSGSPASTEDGLTCTDDNHRKVHVQEDSSEEQLKAGSRQHQHIVSVIKKDGYTKISLLALDLPSGFGDGSSSSQ